MSGFGDAGTRAFNSKLVVVRDNCHSKDRHRPTTVVPAVRATSTSRDFVETAAIDVNSSDSIKAKPIKMYELLSVFQNIRFVEVVKQLAVLVRAADLF